MKFKSLSQNKLLEWVESETDFINSLSLINLPEDRFKAAKSLIKCLYPEVDLDTKWYSNFLFNTSLTTQIPFSSFMIVDLRPYAAETDFQKYYGVSVNEFSRLV